MYIKNYAPDADQIKITILDITILISRDEYKNVHINITSSIFKDLNKNIILGKESPTNDFEE